MRHPFFVNHTNWLFFLKVLFSFKILYCDLCTLVNSLQKLRSQDSTLFPLTTFSAEPPRSCISGTVLLVLFHIVVCFWQLLLPFTQGN